MIAKGKKILRQTPDFRQAVKTCLINGHAPIAIARAIHEVAIADDRCPGECMGEGLNYSKIIATINGCKNALLQNQT